MSDFINLLLYNLDMLRLLYGNQFTIQFLCATKNRVYTSLFYNDNICSKSVYVIDNVFYTYLQ